MLCGRITRLLAAMSLLMASASATQAGMIFPHGTHMGNTVSFVDVTEDNDSTQAHYGAFETIGDTLTFDPINFGVQDNDLVLSELLDSELQMMIVAKPGYALDTISFSEAGDYKIITEGIVSASVPYFWEISEVDGVAVTGVTGSGIPLFSDSIVSGLATGLWNIGFSVDLNVQLAAYEASNGDLGEYVTKATLNFDNNLAADGMNGGTAFIKKKTFGGVTVTSSVPEPASLGGLLLGMMAMLSTRRR